MSTGDPAMGVNAAGQAQAKVPESACEELEAKNTSLRNDLSNDKAKGVNEPFGANGATTVAHGSLGGGNQVGAASRLLPSRYNKRVVEGLWVEKNKTKRREMLSSGSSNVCPEKPFKYAKGYRPHQSHCESKILESLFRPGNPAPTGTLVLNINWQSSGEPNSKLPCRDCRRLLCHAQKNCGLKIELCKKSAKQKPTPLKCQK